MPDYADILYEVKDDVATIAINRPKRLNAFTGNTINEIKAALLRAADDAQCGVIVLTGVGDRAFSAGGDVEWEAGGGLEALNFPLSRMLVDLPKPVIARVSGYAIGGGNHLAYFCDFTVASDHSIFGQNGPRVGSPAAGYIVSYSASLLGHKRAREMWMLCRRYTAKQALDWGLINAVVPKEELDAEVRRWCDELLALSPSCIKILKASFRLHMQSIMSQEMSTVIGGVAPNHFQTGEQQEGARAFLEKRKPDFRPWR